MKKIQIIKNLEQLRDGILGIPDEFIQMDSYRSDDDRHSTDFMDIHNCGTTGCILGWAPLMGGSLKPISSDFFETTKELDFDKYSERVFGVVQMYDPSDNPHLANVVWKWLFDTNWQGGDPTSLGAAFRIQYLLDNDLKVPEDFNTNRGYTTEHYKKYIDEHNNAI